jgi:integration host factor subunit alpha
MALTKADIVEAMQSDMGFTRHQFAELVESLLETIKSKLESGEDVLVSPFATDALGYCY